MMVRDEEFVVDGVKNSFDLDSEVKNVILLLYNITVKVMIFSFNVYFSLTNSLSIPT